MALNQNSHIDVAGVRSRCSLRISLRMLLIVITCAAIALGLFARWAQQRRSALSAVQRAGAKIRWSAGPPSLLERLFGREVFGNVVEISLRSGHADNALLQHVRVLAELRELDLSDAEIDDQGLLAIARLPLRQLWLQSTRITDASAEILSQMKTLDFLQLNGTAVSDRFLERLEPLPALANLGLRGTSVTSAGMKYLARHPQLRVLDVYHTTVDDAGVAALGRCPALEDLGLSLTNISADVFSYLEELPNLTYVDLNGNRSITAEAVQAFEQSHPRCDVEW